MEILIIAVMATVNMGIVAGTVITMHLKGLSTAESIVKYVMQANETISSAAASVSQPPLEEERPLMTLDDGWAEFHRKKAEVLKDQPEMQEQLDKLEDDIRERRTPAMAEGLHGTRSAL